ATKLAEIPSWAEATAGESERRESRRAREVQPYAICAGWVQVGALTKSCTRPQRARLALATLPTRSSRDGRRGHCGRSWESKLDCGPRATYGLALCVILPTTSAKAPAKGWKVKRISCRPRGQTTARKITSALRISASAPSMLARHHGCQTSLSRRMPPAGDSASTTTSVLA